jgi:hypothetical protein
MIPLVGCSVISLTVIIERPGSGDASAPLRLTSSAPTS